LTHAAAVSKTAAHQSETDNVDHIGHMPNAYLCALDQLGNGDRTASRLAGLIDHHERATGPHAAPEPAPVAPRRRDAGHPIGGRPCFDFNKGAWPCVTGFHSCSIPRAASPAPFHPNSASPN